MCVILCSYITGYFLTDYGSSRADRLDERPPTRRTSPFERRRQEVPPLRAEGASPVLPHRPGRGRAAVEADRTPILRLVRAKHRRRRRGGVLPDGGDAADGGGSVRAILVGRI